MPFTTSTTELTTAATDLAMGLLTLALVLRLQYLAPGDPWLRGVWSAVFALLVGASLLGAVVHGLDLAADTKRLLWLPLYLCLGLTVSLFVVGAAADRWGIAAAQRCLPWAVAAALAFIAVSQLLGGAFVLFLVYEAVAMVAALAIYASLVRRGVPGASTTAAGIALTIIAAHVQASRMRVTLRVPFDHNAVFHLIQMPAVVLIARGVSHSLTAGGVLP